MSCYPSAANVGDCVRQHLSRQVNCLSYLCAMQQEHKNSPPADTRYDEQLELKGQFNNKNKKYVRLWRSVRQEDLVALLPSSSAEL